VVHRVVVRLAARGGEGGLGGEEGNPRDAYRRGATRTLRNHRLQRGVDWRRPSARVRQGASHGRSEERSNGIVERNGFAWKPQVFLTNWPNTTGTAGRHRKALPRFHCVLQSLSNPNASRYAGGFHQGISRHRGSRGPRQINSEHTVSTGSCFARLSPSFGTFNFQHLSQHQQQVISRTGTSSSGEYLEAEFEQNPLDGKADLRVALKMETFQAVVSPPLIQRIGRIVLFPSRIVNFTFCVDDKENFSLRRKRLKFEGRSGAKRLQGLVPLPQSGGLRWKTLSRWFMDGDFIFPHYQPGILLSRFNLAGSQDVGPAFEIGRTHCASP